MLVRFLTGSLLLAMLGCLMIGCSDDTRRITSPSNQMEVDPLSTAFDDLNDQSGAFVDDGYVFDPWNMDVDDDVSPDVDDPMDRFDHDTGVSNKPQDKDNTGS